MSLEMPGSAISVSGLALLGHTSGKHLHHFTMACFHLRACVCPGHPLKAVPKHALSTWQEGPEQRFGFIVDQAQLRQK